MVIDKVRGKTLNDGFIYSYDYAHSQLEKYSKDKASVNKDWQLFFEDIGSELGTDLSHDEISELFQKTAEANVSVRSDVLIDAYRTFGSMAAQLDPLKMNDVRVEDCPVLDPASYGVSDSADIVGKMRSLYCGRRSMEVGHISNLEERRWLIDRYENLPTYLEDKDARIAIYRNMLEVELFEQFLHVKFVGSKRFSVEGCETSMVVFETVIQRLAELGVEECVLGMPHRGRLNCLVRVVGKQYSYIISEFMDKPVLSGEVSMSGDVKYHLGASVTRTLANGKSITLSLTPNPSHLEAVNPVVMGRIKAKQTARKTSKIVGILSHGDSSFSGQGVVYESLQMGNVQGYGVRGCIHLIVNNQIGFTTEPRDYASSRRPTDIAKFLEIPVFHVNGNDPESAYLISRLAAEYQQEFGKDVAINIVGYRKYGHNEGDEPLFTQPVMYKKITSSPSPRQVYERHLLDNGIISQEQTESLASEFKNFLAKELSGGAQDEGLEWLTKQWKGFEYSSEPFVEIRTGIDAEYANKIADILAKLPNGFSPNAKIAKLLEGRVAALKGATPLDWGTAEWFAIGSLMLDGYSVRISGQDSARGTFSHRHAILFDSNNGGLHRLFSGLESDSVRCEVMSSTLSEYGVLGFEYGYSTADPMTLTVWEAQYGDFANGAQIIFDQFISSAELKWLRMSGLTVLLPHGYEGQGPEHSSARVERYLQACAENNMRVVNCTTPANYFHALRRQMVSKIRKPLIVFSPKSLLRHRSAVSPIKDFSANFSYIIGDTTPDLNQVKRVILCSGKIYYDLVEARSKKGLDSNIAIVRIEQLYPLAEHLIAAEMSRYPNVNQLVWCQDEPKNMGAWQYMLPYLYSLGNSLGITPVYIGRKESAATAVGYGSIHAVQQAEIMDKAMALATS